ncbi:F-type H+-transporting ATPase subunit gamma [Babesia microti strain RI]|uniref:ATP synthase subunit gamma n=1 Tax=Babesia microti (strain RI) TaxID=1133968 RepID=A0A1R4A9X2_BABMR|nr:F-type H+-transporting ATPase subunit gamma [Babesia microti strain RI]SJK85808.1 F-type H+-transporting ATPase subunit gamma [Babesia microti strain RI]|eukprot:XP_021338027.1 F-type H+-transporting ATPase subunit gamma [Babesia microti strain RI]
MFNNYKSYAKLMFTQTTRRFFSSGGIQAVGARIKSVKSIQKITKAMKMVAASKLKADQRRLDTGIVYAMPSQKIVNSIEPEQTIAAKTAVVVIASDKGLCGGINSSIIKAVKNLIITEVKGDALIFCIGNKVKNTMEKTYDKSMCSTFTEVTKPRFNFTTSAIVAERVLNGCFDAIYIVYNHFKSAISFETKIIKMPSSKHASLKKGFSAFECEPEVSALATNLYEFNLANTIYSCALDGLAAEQSARMTAMDNASSNAGDMLSKLTLKYNRARQSKITLELIEIISGANAL